MSDVAGFVPLQISTNLKKQMPMIIVGSMTLVATLAWNSAFNSLIDQYVPEKYRSGKNAWFKILYAITLTMIVILITSVILKYAPNSNLK